MQYLAAGKTLKWRVKVPASQADRPVRQVDHVLIGSGNLSRSPSDPFEDPFGDKAAQSRPPRELHTSEAVSLDPPANTDSSNPAASAGFTAQNDPPPPPPSSSASRFLTARRLQQDGPPCDRVYHDRNCCAIKENCDEARHRVLNDPITKISLDITPSFNPDSDDHAEDEENKNAQLGSSPPRVWKDRQGNVLGEGRMVDYRRGRVLVAGEDGEVQVLPFHELSSDDLCFVTAWWGIPAQCKLGDYAFAERNWIPSTFTWTASALCHKPLYFEEVQLERYGHSAGPLVQPISSTAHFFLNVAVLPYKMGINPPQECQYALGYYRPGSCAPWLVPPIPLSLRGGLMQAGAIVGGIYVIP